MAVKIFLMNKNNKVCQKADRNRASSGISFNFFPLWTSDYANKFAQSCRTVPKN